MDSQSLGIIGLGVMGRNLALNAEEKGFDVVVYDPWEQARNNFSQVLTDKVSGHVHIAISPESLVAKLPTPRTILIMVKAGEPVDSVIDSLTPYLRKGDTLIDGGNSHFQDTIRRESTLKHQGFYFIGLGVSGGEEGARNGPSLMAGGARPAYDKASPVLEAMAAKFEGDPCSSLLGADGAGHFIKMIHNGIEYALMQLISEAYVLMRDVLNLDHKQMVETFRCWNETELSSFLIEITADILTKQDDLANGPLVEVILDKAGQKGTGRWSSELALSLGTSAPTITEAVFARYMASQKEERVAASHILSGPSAKDELVNSDIALPALHQAILGSFIAAFAQGLDVIAAAAREYGWQIDLTRTVEIWRSGCVIRASMLKEIAAAYQVNEITPNLMCDPHFSNLLKASQDGWRKTVSLAVLRGISIPALSSSLAYFDAYRSGKLWANMIQAQRDYFGAHTYERTDRPGSFHTEW